jgi:hypothetical protein
MVAEDATDALRKPLREVRVCMFSPSCSIVITCAFVDLAAYVLAA